MGTLYLSLAFSHLWLRKKALGQIVSNWVRYSPPPSWWEPVSEESFSQKQGGSGLPLLVQETFLEAVFPSPLFPLSQQDYSINVHKLGTTQVYRVHICIV